MRVVQLDGLVALVAPLAASILLSTSTTTKVAAAAAAAPFPSFPSTPFYQQNPDRDDLQRSDGRGAGPLAWSHNNEHAELGEATTTHTFDLVHDDEGDDDNDGDDTFNDSLDDGDDEKSSDESGSYLEGGGRSDAQSSRKHKKRKGWVYLIRHGEKVKSSDKTGLSSRGVQRAKCLTNVFGRRRDSDLAHGMKIRYPTDYILAQDFKPSGQRRRPYETVKPLAKYHGIKLDHSCDRDDERCASRKIKKRTRAGKNVLVVWEHARLSEIARELGVTGLVYPSERYDIVFKIRGKKVHSIVSEKCQGLDEEWMHWKSERKGKHGRSPHGGRLIDDESWADEPIGDDDGDTALKIA